MCSLESSTLQRAWQRVGAGSWRSGRGSARVRSWKRILERMKCLYSTVAQSRSREERAEFQFIPVHCGLLLILYQQRRCKASRSTEEISKKSIAAATHFEHWGNVCQKTSLAMISSSDSWRWLRTGRDGRGGLSLTHARRGNVSAAVDRRYVPLLASHVNDNDPYAATTTAWSSSSLCQPCQGMRQAGVSRIRCCVTQL
ncbi:hypothetical protein MPH_09292 [Macrophomina phaseolina MS6]|uniref:Uncharacterized protein n=1 Tax=Macrophomina phaseolina (strain MS6) TaxID=1126212 RepID=K2RG25_MACPH|nr:hypothetical protein MPH_09292 [Macrophomina phaseolina MS6]